MCIRDSVCGYETFFSVNQYLVEYCLSLIDSADCRKYVRFLSLSSWRFSRETPFLFERRKGLSLHAFLFVGPTKNCMRGNSARIQFQSFTTLCDGIIKTPGEEKYIAYPGGDNGRLW